MQFNILTHYIKVSTFLKFKDDWGGEIKIIHIEFFGRSLLWNLHINVSVRNFAKANSKFWRICKKLMCEGTESVSNIESVPSIISYKSFKTYNLPMQNSYCDHRHFDSVNQA